MDKRRIAHLTSAHKRSDTRIFIKQCSSLASKYDITLIVADGLGNDVLNDVSIVDIGSYERRMNRMVKAPKAILNKAVKINADIYHLHDPELIPIGLILKKQGKKVIFDAHEDLPNQILSKHYINPILRKPLSKLVRVIERKTCARLDAVVTATPYIRDKFLNINSNTVDINNYPKLQEFDSLNSENKRNNQVCYIGGISEVRGIVEIVQAIELTRNRSYLKLAGSFIDKSSELKVKLLDGWENVEYLGFVGRDGIKETLLESVAGLVTLHPTLSYINSLPVKMFEYMGAGIPVIASNFPLWNSIINTEACGLCVDPLNPKEIADAIDYLIENPDIAADMGQNGRDAVYEKYNWSIEEEKLLKLYDELLGN